MVEKQDNNIIYNTDDGKAYVTLYAIDGTVRMNQSQITGLFDTYKQKRSKYECGFIGY